MKTPLFLLSPKRSVLFYSEIDTDVINVKKHTLSIFNLLRKHVPSDKIRKEQYTNFEKFNILNFVLLLLSLSFGLSTDIFYRH